VTKERLDVGLLDAIRAESRRPDARWARPPRQLRGGYFATILKVRLEGVPGLDGDLVARILPDPGSWEREIVAQRLASEQGFPTPTVRMGSLPTSAFDRAWILMDYAEGTPPLAAASARGFLGALPRRIWRTPNLLAEALVRLHSVDVGGAELNFGRPGVAGRSLEWLYSDATRLGSRDLMERAERLLATRPRYRGAVLCHGDLHPINVLRSPGGDSIVDWTYATYDDPLYDVAVTRLILWYLPLNVPLVLRPVVASVGRTLALRFVSRYETLSGGRVDRERLEWFTRLATLRIMTSVEDWRQGRDLGRPSNHPFYRLDAMLRKEQW